MISQKSEKPGNQGGSDKITCDSNVLSQHRLSNAVYRATCRSSVRVLVIDFLFL